MTNILIVDDHTDSALMLSKMLSCARGEYDIVTSGSCREAIAAVQKRRFNLLLCDIGLPDGDGCGLLKEVLAMYPIPAIAITGYDSPDDLQLYRQAGFKDHVVKPFALNAILKSIDRVIVAIDENADID